MDTPERNQIGTPVSKIEESPFSNFANNLSPINHVKTLHVSQTFNSLSFSSPPSVFTSPHVSFQKESQFLRRHQASDIAKTHLSCDEGNKDSQGGEALGAEEQTDGLTNEQFRGEGPSCSERADDTEPPCEVPQCPTENQSMLMYNSGSPDCENSTKCENEQNRGREAGGAIVPFSSEPSFVGTFGAKLNSQGREHHINEEATCWSLISNIVFDSPNDPATLKGSFQKSLEEETSVFASLLSRFPPNNVNDPQNSHHPGPVSYNEAHETTTQIALPIEAGETTQADQQTEILSISSLNGCFSGDSGEKSGNELFSNLQRGMRRRCLNFEPQGAKNNVESVTYPSSSSVQKNEVISVPDDNHPITPRDSLRCILPGIGLHLNALAAASRECRVPHQDTPQTNQETLMILSASNSSEKHVSPDEHGVQAVEDSSQALTYAVTQELNPNSPKKKRRKSENNDETDGCKRCNCKKSKCLKLYCECFAAGIYCVDSCSCKECFNKPIHEDTVLATRKQIETRNPLAFAPKVIRTSDPAHDIKEDPSRTPASARHKRGCNCKKSNCLKKYCECYQGGVGCSINCRCEGCKNAYGRKDGPSLPGTETGVEEAQVSGKHIMECSLNPPVLRSDEDHSSGLSLPKTPLRHFRPSMPLPTSSKGKPPRSLGTMGSSSCLQSIDGPGRSTFLRCQSNIENHFRGNEIPIVLHNGSPPSSGVKTLSPNGKRISPPQSHIAKVQSTALRSSRKLILQSIPSFPSLTPRR